MSTVYGLSYRYWPGDYGAQVVFTPMTDGTNTTINLVTAGFKSPYNTIYTILFLFLAANSTYYNNDNVDWETQKSSREQYFDFSVG